MITLATIDYGFDLIPVIGSIVDTEVDLAISNFVDNGLTIISIVDMEDIVESEMYGFIRDLV